MRRSIVTLVASVAVAASALAAAPADAATYADPLTRGDLISYNHHDYRLSIRPVTGARPVIRFGHAVPATYSVRLIDPTVRGDVVVFSARLGYSRAAYLRTRTVSLDTVRGYGLATYAKKVTGFSAAHAARRVAVFAAASRHRTQHGDVAATVAGAKASLQEHGTLAGADPKTIVVKSDGFFGYEHARIRLMVDPYDDGDSTEFVVYGFDPTDGFQVLYDSSTGRTRSTTSEDDLVLLP